MSHGSFHFRVPMVPLWIKWFWDVYCLAWTQTLEESRIKKKKEKKKEKKNPSIPLASLENRVLKEYEKKWM